MARSILVGLDGSAHSSAAVELGIRWAKQTNGLLVGLGIIDEPAISQPLVVPPGAVAHEKCRTQALLADAQRKVEAYLQQFSIRCAEAGIASKVLQDIGMPAEQIMLEAQRYDMILLGQQTYFEFETQLGVDDTLQKVVMHGPRPVIAVPEKPSSGTSVIVAYDGSVQAARALQAFQAAGKSGLQPIHVVCVLPDHVEAAKCGSRAIDFLSFHGVKAQLHAIGSSDKPAQQVLKQARELNAGLVVMGAYGQSGWKEFFFGSVTQTLLRHSDIPLFLYH